MKTPALLKWFNLNSHQQRLALGVLFGMALLLGFMLEGSPTGSEIRQGRRCVDVVSSQSKKVNVLVMAACDGRLSQQWHYNKRRELVNLLGSCMDIKGGKASPKQLVIAYSCHNAPNQKWNFHSAGNQIVGMGGLCLDSRKKLNGKDALMVERCGQNEHQRWEYEGAPWQ